MREETRAREREALRAMLALGERFQVLDGPRGNLRVIYLGDRRVGTMRLFGNLGNQAALFTSGVLRGRGLYFSALPEHAELNALGEWSSCARMARALLETPDEAYAT